MLPIKTELKRLHISNQAIADAAGISKTNAYKIISHGIYPVKQDAAALATAINTFLTTKGCQVLLPIPSAAITKATPLNPSTEEDPMLLRKQNLTPAAKKSFGLPSNPFTGDIQSAAELYQTPDVRYVRESMYQAAKHGGFIAVCAESGAGKTTLRRDLIDRIDREKLNIIVIEPYVLAAEDNDIKGKTLKSAHIAESILATLAPTQNAKRSPEARFRQIHNLLKSSSKAGYQHVIIIEEAHSLPIPTLKHLKRFFELEDGYKKLLSIILIGQNELAQKLSEGHQEVREVVQRCEIVTLEPLTREKLGDYLAHRCKTQSIDLNNLIDSTGIDAIADRLTPQVTGRNKSSNSLLYPLAIGNLITAALNAAADIGIPVVNRDVVMGV